MVCAKHQHGDDKTQDGRDEVQEIGRQLPTQHITWILLLLALVETHVA